MIKKFEKGFTLIELLIVIALLGALAIGLIGAIDPFEQLKKGTDTGTRNNVSEVHGAIIRFFALKSWMPWCADAACAVTQPSMTALNAAPMGTGVGTALDNMINSGELKANFTTVSAGDLAKVFVTGDATTATVAVCYKPIAKSFQADPNTKYNQDGTSAAAGTCKSAGGGTDCYWCVQ